MSTIAGRPSGSEHLFDAHLPALSDFREEKEELDRVLSYPEISRSSNAVRFLSFVCRKYFEGKSKEIREYTIALEALGRKESSFDSNMDPIVRVTACALRKRLGQFYANAGKSHALKIVLPCGHYVPQFVRRSTNCEKVNGHDKEDQIAALANIAISKETLPSDHVIGPTEVTRPESEYLPAANSPATVARNPIWKISLFAFALSLVFFAGFWIGRRTNVRAGTRSKFLQWEEPVWSDEFNGTSGQVPDPSNWTYDTGSQKWGNHESETYCAPGSAVPKGCDPRSPNAFLDGEGHLVLRAAKGADSRWTSARITTKDLQSFQYGRIEARMKLPVGAGLWPAFWMMGTNAETMRWPSCGAVDLVENVPLSAPLNGLGPTIIRSTLHGPRYSGGNGLWHDFELPNGARVDDQSFHIYGAIWSPGMVQFYVDNPANVFFVRTSSDIPEEGQWVFDHPFFLIMDLAVGGDWPGKPDDTTPSPAEMLVDYVRVYKAPRVQAPKIEWQPVRIKAGSAAASIISLRAQSFAGHVHLSCSTEPASAICALGASTVDLSDTLSQNDTLTISTNSATNHGGEVAEPGKYKLTITATTISGDQSQLVAPFEVTTGD